MERGLTADFAFVKAWKGDREGNLIYRKTARNFNPLMATAAKITIAEVEHLVDVGELAGDSVHTPSIYVKRIFQGELYEHRIEEERLGKQPRRESCRSELLVILSEAKNLCTLLGPELHGPSLRSG